VKSQNELFRTLELRVRTSRERLPIDAFLPAPESLPTDFPDPPPSALPAQVREMGTLAEAEERKKERRRLRRGKKPPEEQAGQEKPRNLEDEIQEFMNRDLPPGVHPEALSQFMAGSDPSDTPEDE
jgi:hypothetical protein